MATAPTETVANLPAAAAATGGFHWGSATPESQGMCGSTRQLGCTRTLLQIWNSISKPIHNTKRFIVIRNDRVIYSKGVPNPYHGYSVSKGLLGAPTLVYAMSRCGVGLGDPASTGWDMPTAPGGSAISPGPA